MTYQALPKELHVKDSPIAGQGIFAREDIDAMMYIGVSHIIIDDIEHNHVEGDINNHPKTW